MTQPRFVVPRLVVDSLVDDYIASRKGRNHEWCSSFDPDGLRAALRALPGDAFVDFNAASHALVPFECDRLTSLCNRWTPWMRHRLNITKHKAP